MRQSSEWALSSDETVLFILNKRSAFQMHCANRLELESATECGVETSILYGGNVKSTG
jgi:hypothetical protein